MSTFYPRGGKITKKVAIIGAGMLKKAPIIGAKLFKNPPIDTQSMGVPPPPGDIWTWYFQMTAIFN